MGIPEKHSCCEEFAENSGEPSVGIEEHGGKWSVNGCCGGGCYVLSEIKFCPFCGAELSKAAVGDAVAAADSR